MHLKSTARPLELLHYNCFIADNKFKILKMYIGILHLFYVSHTFRKIYTRVLNFIQNIVIVVL